MLFGWLVISMIYVLWALNYKRLNRMRDALAERTEAWVKGKFGA